MARAASWSSSSSRREKTLAYEADVQAWYEGLNVRLGEARRSSFDVAFWPSNGPKSEHLGALQAGVPQRADVIPWNGSVDYPVVESKLSNRIRASGHYKNNSNVPEPFAGGSSQ